MLHPKPGNKTSSNVLLACMHMSIVYIREGQLVHAVEYLICPLVLASREYCYYILFRRELSLPIHSNMLQKLQSLPMHQHFFSSSSLSTSPTFHHYHYCTLHKKDNYVCITQRAYMLQLCNTMSCCHTMNVLLTLAVTLGLLSAHSSFSRPVSSPAEFVFS